MSSRNPRPLLAIILLAYLIITLAYGVVNPIFEAPDEQHHYFTAQTIAETGRLPFVGEEPDGWMAQEAAQPPLYYILAGWLIKPIDTSAARDQVWINPRTQLGDASSPTNTNAFVHTAVEEWPWRGYVLAAHVLRAFSALIGLGTLLCIYASGRLIWPERPGMALLATAMVAFLPQFNFLHAAISNDTLIVLFSSAALWQLIRLWYSRPTPLSLILLGITLGMAIMSKMAGLLLLVYALGFLAVLAWGHTRQELATSAWPAWLGRLGLVGLLALLVGGWVMWRNWTLYQDITATSQFIDIAGGDRDVSLWQVLDESGGLWTSLFAVFGWFNVRAPRWVYLIWDGLALAAALGTLWHVYRERGRSHSQPWYMRWLLPGLLAGWLLLVYAGLVQFMLRTPAAQGRLLFPALIPLSLGLAYGLSRWRQRWLYWLAPGLALISSLYCLLFVIPPAYARPPVIAGAGIPATASRINADLGQGLVLLAAEVETASARPGDWIWLTLYWQADPVPEEAPEFVLELFGRENELVSKLQSYHGGGLYPASLWQPGDVLVDRLGVRLFEEMTVPTQVRLNVKLVDETAAVDVGAVKVGPEEWPAPEGESLAGLEGVELLRADLSRGSARPGETVMVDVQWWVIAAPGRDLTTFVHLGEPSQPPLATGDSPPLAGDYPTALWAAGEVVDDRYQIALPGDLPPGEYPIHLGQYDPASGVRVPLTVDGQRQPNDAYLVGWLTILP
jgi:hypothetical protein